ncbi:MAG: thermonuclease family protein [Burkholderiales bacterium]|nr:thermonuclease family protein [Burkholderiales bacterium]
MICALASLASATVHAQPAAGETMYAKIVAYGSASAFAVLDAEKKVRRIKLTGVDAPERDQRFAQQAQRLASDHLGTGPIAITIDAIGDDARVHGRVGVDGGDLGLVLLEAGLAWCDPGDSASVPAALRNAYAHACTQARAQRRGVWQDANPVPPWEYRKIPRFGPLPERAQSKHCRQIGYQSLQCDDGTRYRDVGRRVTGSDGSAYSRRGNTVTGNDGNRFQIQGKSVYGTDGSVCRMRGRLVECR